MTRASKRKSDNQTSAPVKTARVDSVRSGISRPAQLFTFISLFCKDFQSLFFVLPVFVCSFLWGLIKPFVLGYSLSVSLDS